MKMPRDRICGEDNRELRTRINQRGHGSLVGVALLQGSVRVPVEVVLVWLGRVYDGPWQLDKQDKVGECNRGCQQSWEEGRTQSFCSRRIRI